MATNWTPVELTTLCTAPTPGTLMLPQGTQTRARVVLLRQNGKVRLLKCGLRSDPGAAACADASVVAAGESGEYATPGWWQVIRYSTAVKFQLAIAILTAVATLLAAFVTFFNNANSDKNPFAARTAFVAVFVATILAVVKFIKDWRDAFSGS